MGQRQAAAAARMAGPRLRRAVTMLATIGLLVVCAPGVGAAAGSSIADLRPAQPGTAALARTVVVKLTASGGHTAVYGQPVVLTAVVKSARGDGFVQFTDGATRLGEPVRASRGTATLIWRRSAPGTHFLRAAYLGDPCTRPATSAPVVFIVQALVIVSGPASVAPQTDARYQVSVVPANLSGYVGLWDLGRSIKTAAVKNGKATFTLRFPRPGTHKVFALFVNGFPGVIGRSAVITTVVGGSAPANAVSQNIETQIASGALVLNVDSSAPVILPPPTTSSSGDSLVTGGDINSVSVTDTRRGAPGFDVSGVVSDFVAVGPAQGVINGADLGWAPYVMKAAVGMSVTAGRVVRPAPAIAPGQAPADPALGLRSSRLLATNAPGGLGTVGLGAHLTLIAPTNTPPGRYVSTLTITAI